MQGYIYIYIRMLYSTNDPASVLNHTQTIPTYVPNYSQAMQRQIESRFDPRYIANSISAHLVAEWCECHTYVNLSLLLSFSTYTCIICHIYKYMCVYIYESTCLWGLGETLRKTYTKSYKVLG